jgi:hypothetical protein
MDFFLRSKPQGILKNVPKKKSVTKRLLKSIVPDSIRSVAKSICSKSITQKNIPKKVVKRVVFEDGTKDVTLCENGIKPDFKKMSRYKEYLKYYNTPNLTNNNFGCGKENRIKYVNGRYCCVDKYMQATPAEIMQFISWSIESLLDTIFLEIHDKNNYHPKTMKHIVKRYDDLVSLMNDWKTLYESNHRGLVDDERLRNGLSNYYRAVDKIEEIKKSVEEMRGYLKENNMPILYSKDEMDIKREMETEKRLDGTDVYGYRSRREKKSDGTHDRVITDKRKTFGGVSPTDKNDLGV